MSILSSPATFSDSMPLGEARARLRELVYDGHRCPCCTQYAKVYRWSLYGSAGRLLILLWRKGRTTDFVESKSVKVPGQGGDVTRLNHWGLVEQESERRPDGGKSGWWRVTPLGEQFVLGQATIPKYVYTYDGRCLNQDGPLRTIHDVLDKKFSYRELMDGV